MELSQGEMYLQIDTSLWQINFGFFTIECKESEIICCHMPAGISIHPGCRTWWAPYWLWLWQLVVLTGYKNLWVIFKLENELIYEKIQNRYHWEDDDKIFLCVQLWNTRSLTLPHTGFVWVCMCNNVFFVMFVCCFQCSCYIVSIRINNWHIQHILLVCTNTQVLWFLQVSAKLP